jgi:queuine tRNA-ribosyltransferase
VSVVDPRAGLSCERTDLPARPPGTFEVLATAGTARAGRLWTAHGPIDTPCFMPVGTYGAVKGLVPDELELVGSQVILGNSYHLAHRPGAALVRELGGLHEMMGWSRAILTDSGGYQVFSLRGLQCIDDDGVDYRTHFDGSAHRMTPQSVLETQAALGSDICMVLDHCPPADAAAVDLRRAVDRTTRWAELAATLRPTILAPSQLCFGIVQGATDLDVRRAHIETMAALPFDGLALGGLSVGEPPATMHATMHAIAPLMPASKPRYVMGIGTPIDLLEAVASGVDMFDCVMPTRNARNGQLFTRAGKLNIRRAENKGDRRPVDPGCICPTCTRFSRAYLRHLHGQDDPLFGRLATLHNLFFFHAWVARMRRALLAGTFTAEIARMSTELASAAPEPGEADVSPA